jgi:cytochrome c553
MKLSILLFSALLINNLSYSATPKEQVEAKRQLLVDRVNKILKDPNKYRSAMIEAKDRVLFCSYCHGKDGNSNQPGIPRLAGQNAIYLLDQIEKFAKKERKQFVMNQLAKNFTDHEKTILAVYYSNNKVIPASGDIEKAKQAAPHYNNVCIKCHGANGKGEAGYARIAGQRPDYVINTLKAFRSHNPDRRNGFMETYTNNLTDKQIENLAAYIANLR